MYVWALTRASDRDLPVTFLSFFLKERKLHDLMLIKSHGTFSTASEIFISFCKYNKDFLHCAILINKVKNIKTLHWHGLTCFSYVFSLLAEQGHP